MKFRPGNYNVPLIKKAVFRRVLGEIRKLTVEAPDLFISEMTQLCANAGVAFVLVREMKKVPWFGATKWLSPDKAMVLLNQRLKTEDHFWFSFFHEAGHVLNDGKKYIFINDGTKNDPKEISADEFAAEILVPKKWEQEVITLRSYDDLYRLSKKIGVSPGIVAGRYQYLTKKWNYFNKAKLKLVWTSRDGQFD